MKIQPIQQISIESIKTTKKTIIKTFVNNIETKQKDSIHNISKYHVNPLSEKWNKILKKTKEFFDENSF